MLDNSCAKCRGCQAKVFLINGATPFLNNHLDGWEE